MGRQGEDVVRASGVPFAVVRPTALTEEDAGAELQFDQGDTIKVTGRPGHLGFDPVIYLQLSDILISASQRQVREVCF